MKTVKLTKLSGKPNSSTKIGYWVQGVLHSPIKLGKPACLDAPVSTSSNNEHHHWFRTTMIDRIEDKAYGTQQVIYTQNSTWLVEEINEPS